MASVQGRYWLLTIPEADWVPALPNVCSWVIGQLEVGGETGYRHWQVLAVFKKKIRLGGIKCCFGNSCHAELSRSSAATDYVQKEETRVEGTSFEFGSKPLNRADSKDWEQIKSMAKAGDLDSIPPDVFIRSYRTLRSIYADYAQPLAMERCCMVFWGATGTGKSRRAWSEAGLEAYPKDPRTKFWCGYRGQANVVIDEFRGGIDIGHLLRWLDRYPVIVEVKGSATVLSSTKIWITSNLHPRDWYPELDSSTFDALSRRLRVTHFVGDLPPSV